MRRTQHDAIEAICKFAPNNDDHPDGRILYGYCRNSVVIEKYNSRCIPCQRQYCPVWKNIARLKKNK